MACPECGCKVTYTYDDDECGDLDRCANCGNIFDINEAIDEEDDH